MPYYPQSPGFYPPLNSVTDAQLVDMPDGTVKGRALGAGLGDPTNLTPAQLQTLVSPVGNTMLATMPDATLKGRALGAGVGVPTDLTVAQLRALLGNPSYTQCRLEYASSTTMRLDRCGGKFLTIDDVTQVIPAGGVILTIDATLVGINPLYIYAQMNAGAVALIAHTSAPALDPRNGVMVSGSYPQLTLVGMAYVYATGPSMVEDGNNQAVSSYWNRRPRAYAYGQNNQTSSTTPVLLHNPIKMLCWADSAYSISTTGWSQLNVAGITLGQIYTDGNPTSQQCIAYFTTPNGQSPLALTLATRSADGLHSFQLGGYVGAGTGTFVGNTYAVVMG